MSKSGAHTQRVRRGLLRERTQLTRTAWKHLDVKGSATVVFPVDLPLDSDWVDGPLTTGSSRMRLEYEVDKGEIVAVAVIAQVLDGDWLLRASVVSGDAGPEFDRIELRPASGSAVVGARTLRKLGFGEVVDEASRWLSEEGVRHYLGDAWAKPLPRPGRRGREPIFYARWAKRYVEAVTEAPGAPIPHMIAKGPETGLTPQQIRWYLTEARQRGLLTAAPRGAAGGELTPEALSLLKSFGED